MYLEWDYDTRIWVEIPQFDEFDVWQDHREWANQKAKDVWAASGLRPRRGEIENLAEVLRYLAERRLEDETPEAGHFIYIPHPQAIPSRIRAWLAHHPECDLRDWVIADDPDAVEPPLVEEFVSPKLGRGLRAFRCRIQDHTDEERPEGELYAVLRYAFPVGGENTAVVVSAVAPDPSYILKAMPDLDELARNLWLVDIDGETLTPAP